MSLVNAIPRQPTQHDIDDCDRQIDVWRRKQLQAEADSPWAAACATVIDDWLELRSQVAAILHADGGDSEGNRD
jgi:hypothetical protein